MRFTLARHGLRRRVPLLVGSVLLSALTACGGGASTGAAATAGAAAAAGAATAGAAAAGKTTGAATTTAEAAIVPSAVTGSTGSADAASAAASNLAESSSAAAASAASSTAASDGAAVPATTKTQPPTAADAARLLEQSTFGVTQADVAHVQKIGINPYISEQMAAPITQYVGLNYMPFQPPANCMFHPATPTDASGLCARDNYTPFQLQRKFFVHALNDSDQLRQRVAFALSQMFVVSSVEIYEAYALAAYENMLLNDAFVNFRTLLEDVTLSPVMGQYLDMVNNEKTNATQGARPNENYAREILQLFSIGLYHLNADGTAMVDANGVPVPTYDQDTVDGLAAVFTGWTYPPLPGVASHWENTIYFGAPMVIVPNYHQSGTKQLLNGVSIPANQTPAQDLKMALDNIFNHPNVGPFIGKQLIQHLVTSNPSPAYVARVSAVFADNGQGVRGDLGAVVRAILTDSEARGDQPSATDYGRLREPALFITGTLRSLGGFTDGVMPHTAVSNMGQSIYAPQTVFNFFAPSQTLPGSHTLAPEFGIDNATTALAKTNFIDTVIIGGGERPDPTVSGSVGTRIDLTPFAATTDPAALVAQMNTILMHGSLPADASSVIVDAVKAVTSTAPLAKVRVAAYLILTSAQYQVER